MLCKPGIVAAVLLNGLTGMVLACGGLPPVRTGIACLAALLFAASGAAIINNLLDASLDRRMERCRIRSAALERIGGRGATLAALTAITFALLLTALCLNLLATLLLLAAVLCYTLVYTTFLKRRSPHGAVPGGIPGALPALIGYGAASGSIGADGMLLFFIMLLWQPPHFWTLALHHRDDYRAAGIPVLPVVYGERYTTILIYLYAAALFPASLSLWLLGYCSGWYAGFALILLAGFLAVCRQSIDGNRRFDRAFQASILYICALHCAILLDICLGPHG